jgi:hypothetical protein
MHCKKSLTIIGMHESEETANARTIIPIPPQFLSPPLLVRRVGKPIG